MNARYVYVDASKVYLLRKTKKTRKRTQKRTEKNHERTDDAASRRRIKRPKFERLNNNIYKENHSFFRRCVTSDCSTSFKSTSDAFKLLTRPPSQDIFLSILHCDLESSGFTHLCLENRRDNCRQHYSYIIILLTKFCHILPQKHLFVTYDFIVSSFVKSIQHFSKSLKYSSSS